MHSLSGIILPYLATPFLAPKVSLVTMHLHEMLCCVSLQGERTALHLAARSNSVDVVNLLLMKDLTLIEQSDIVSKQIL